MATRVLTLCVFASCLVSRVCALCEFPKALQTTGDKQTNYWRLNVSPLEGTETQTIFDRHTFVSHNYIWWTKGATENGTCIAYNGSTDIYVVAFEREDMTNAVTYACVQFRRRTDNVFEASISDKVNTTALLTCDNETFHPHDVRLMVSKEPRGRSSQAPIRPVITGSFEFSATASDTATPICQTSTLPSLFSGSCMPGDGITLTFPDKVCIPDQTGWTIGDNTLLYTDTWETGDFQYALVGAEYFDPQYVLRIPMDRESDFTMEIYFSLVAPTGEWSLTAKHLTLNATSLGAESLCIDDRLDCIAALCDARLYDRVCRKTCNTCVNTTSDNRCVFPEKLHGLWIQYSDDNTADVTINGSVISVSSYRNFTCVDEYVQGSYFVTRTDFNDGCQSQYTCIEIDPISDSVLNYRIGHSVVDSQAGAYLCLPEQFSDDPEPLSNTFRSQFYKLVVDNSTLWDEPRPCDLGGYYTLDSVTLSTGSTCSGNLSDVTSGPKVLEMYLECDTGPEMFVYQCRDRFDLSPPGLKAMLSISVSVDNHTPDVQCWIFSSTSSDEMSFYVMPSAQCNDGSLADVTSARRTPLINGKAVFVSSRPSSAFPDVHTTDTSVTEDDVTFQAVNISTPEVTLYPTLPITSTRGTPPNGTVSPRSEDSGDGAGHVVGIVFGSLLGAVLVACVAFLGWRFYKVRRQPYSILWQSTRRESLEI